MSSPLHISTSRRPSSPSPTSPTSTQFSYDSHAPSFTSSADAYCYGPSSMLTEVQAAHVRFASSADMYLYGWLPGDPPWRDQAEPHPSSSRSKEGSEREAVAGHSEDGIELGNQVWVWHSRSRSFQQQSTAPNRRSSFQV